MRVRRCGVLFVEAYEEPTLDLQSLLTGGDGVVCRQVWRAFAPHLEGPVELVGGEYALLGQLESVRWRALDDLDASLWPAARRLLQTGLVISDDAGYEGHRARDEAVRGAHWWGPAALMHRFGRWQGMDSVAAMQEAGTESLSGQLAWRGPPPPEVVSRAVGAAREHLPRIDATDFDLLLAQRATCRNFDSTRTLPLEKLAGMLQRVFAAQGQAGVGTDAVLLKKNAPSAGGLHCVEAYLLIRGVDGLASGLYHYHPVDHALEPIESHERDLDVLARRMLAGQHWFSDAPVLIAMTPRYERIFWKYRNHAKAYRAMILDVGHLSQLLYMCATEAGLAAFVTSAINEVDVEQAFGMNALHEGPLAICGFGWRATTMSTEELDPGEQVWLRTDVERIKQESSL
jgi:putative peptide maturation dehydrogenase